MQAGIKKTMIGSGYEIRKENLGSTTYTTKMNRHL